MKRIVTECDKCSKPGYFYPVTVIVPRRLAEDDKTQTYLVGLCDKHALQYLRLFLGTWLTDAQRKQFLDLATKKGK